MEQMKRKDNNKNDEQSNKRVFKSKKFKAIKYLPGPNEEFIAIKRCEYNAWERNEDSVSQIYQANFQKKGRRLDGLAIRRIHARDAAYLVDRLVF
nr:hypothetical protein [Tanacetum cinerariifolium]